MSRPWSDQALCAPGRLAADFFDDDGQGDTREALKLCDLCLVKRECLAWAMDNNEQFGIWGGTTETERRRMRKSNALLGGAR